MRVAVIGTGSIGSRHLRLLKQLKGVEGIPISKREENFQLLEGVSHCIIASETACHVGDALRALDKGCHLLIEKPVAPSLQEALPLLSKKMEKRIVVGCVLRFSASLHLFKEWLKEIGECHGVSIACQSYLPDWRPSRPYHESYSARSREGGVLRDLVHEIDYAGWLFGWPKRLFARLKNTGRLGIASEEMADLWWETQKGVWVSITLDYLTRPTRRTMTAQGSRGRLEWDGLQNSVHLILADGKSKKFKAQQSMDDMYSEQLKSFLNLSSESKAQASLEEGLKVLAICDAAREANQNRREVEIAYFT